MYMTIDVYIGIVHISNITNRSPSQNDVASTVYTCIYQFHDLPMSTASCLNSPSRQSCIIVYPCYMPMLSISLV